MESQLVKDFLLGEKPCSIGKMGSIELMHFAHAIINDRMEFFGKTLTINAGLNFRTWDEYKYWVDDFKKALTNIDVLLSWVKNSDEATVIEKCCSENSRIVENFSDIEPFFHREGGWHYFLKDQKVLVISSFKDSIESQLPNYSKIWSGAEIGECNIIRCPQPHQITGGDRFYYADAMEKLKHQIKEQDFDICIIGAGGYSLPLCDFVKNLGKKAIHLGGAIQVLFGIRGSRFDRNFVDQSWYGTEHFIRPLPSDIPANHFLVEGSCYW